MLAFLGNLGPLEIVVILVLAVLIFGKDLPQAASKAYLQARKLRNAVDDLRRESGIEREIRNIERGIREAEWEAKKEVQKLENVVREEPKPRPSAPPPRPEPPGTSAAKPEAPTSAAQPAAPSQPAALAPPAPPGSEPPPGPTGAAS